MVLELEHVAAYFLYVLFVQLSIAHSESPVHTVNAQTAYATAGAPHSSLTEFESFLHPNLGFTFAAVSLLSPAPES